MLELKDLTVSYDICILDHVNYIFPDTGLVGIKGPSGCGKSHFYIVYVDYCNIMEQLLLIMK